MVSSDALPRAQPQYEEQFMPPVDFSIPSGPSIESCTTNTVQLTGSLDSGLSSQDCTRPVRDISEVVIN